MPCNKQPQFYISRTAEEEIVAANQYTQNKSFKAPQQERKDASRKAKRARLDPTQQQTTVDVQLVREGHLGHLGHLVHTTQHTHGRPLLHTTATPKPLYTAL
jgi:hypothetical protein